jgi:1-acyl-sn-glycerol-3-phosphate acyltransferase
MTRDADFIPGSFSPRFAAGFAWYASRLLRKKFHALRLSNSSPDCLREAAKTQGPLIVLLTHSSWWDPLICCYLARYFMPTRQAMAPMESDMLRKFAFFKRVGLFGINPENQASLDAMKRYVLDRFERVPTTTLWITPQGEFTDPRSPLVLRPGAAAIAARTQSPTVLAVAIEYAFWLDQRPEIFLHAQPVKPPTKTDSTPRWHAAMTSALHAARETLAADVINRDPSAFTLESSAGSSINPLYDLWLRLRGRAPGIDSPRVGRGGPMRSAQQ